MKFLKDLHWREKRSKENSVLLPRAWGILTRPQPGDFQVAIGDLINLYAII
jgi:hypothetical protein